MSKVFVAIYTHSYNRDIKVYATAQDAEQWRRSIADKWWNTEFQNRKKPDDPAKLANDYFSKTRVCGGEFFEVEELNVIGETQRDRFVAEVAGFAASGDGAQQTAEGFDHGYEHDTGHSLDVLDSIIHGARMLSGLPHDERATVLGSVAAGLV